MASVFGNVFRMSGGESVWANVFVLETATDPNEGWAAAIRNRLFVPNAKERVLICEAKQRVWIAGDGQ